MTSRILIGCVLWTFFAFPAFLAAEESQEKPLDAETQKLWDAHTVVPKADDIQKLRAFLQYGIDNWTQMNGHIHSEETWNRFHIAKNKATFEAANRIIELAKREPGKEPPPAKNQEEFYGWNDNDDLKYALKAKTNAFNGARDWDHDWEQHFQDFVKEMKKDPANKYRVKQAEAAWFGCHFNAAIFPKGMSGKEVPPEESLRLYEENFKNLKNYCAKNADDPYLKYAINYWRIPQVQAAEIIEGRHENLKKGTLVKPALEFYRSLYTKYDPDDTEGWIRNINQELEKYEIITAENPLAAFRAKVAELKKSLEEKTDEDSAQKVFALFFIAEEMEQRSDAQRLLLTTVRPFFAKSEDEKVQDYVLGFDVTLAHLALEGQKFEFEAILMDGKKIDIKDYRGKIVVLDYWATWCGPCIGEIPMLKTFYKNWQEESGRAELIGFSVDEDLDDLKAFLEKEKLPWPTASEALSKEKKLADSRKKYDIKSFPTTILIDQEGTVVRAGNGLFSIIQDFAKLNAKSKEKDAGKN